jgi:hypothetical protein
MCNMRLLWNIVDDSTVLFRTVVVHGEMLWFCRVPAWAREKDAKIVEICKKFSRKCGVFYHLEISLPWCSLKGILATIESNAFASDFASILAPYKYGIALPEGMQSLQWLFGISCMTCFRELPTWQVLLTCWLSQLRSFFSWFSRLP